MRTDNLVREMANTWVDGGGDEAGISNCLHQLREAVCDEIQRRAKIERFRVELNKQVEVWEAELHARANECWKRHPHAQTWKALLQKSDEGAK